MGIILNPGDVIAFYGALQKRRKLAALIGIIAAEWTSVETIMALNFCILLGIDATITAEMFDSIKNTKQKRDMLVNVAKAKLKNKKLFARLKSATKDLQDIGIERNNVVHGKWGVCKRWPDQLIRSRGTTTGPDEMELWDAGRFKDLVHRIVERRNAIQSLVNEIVDDLGIIGGKDAVQAIR